MPSVKNYLDPDSIQEEADRRQVNPARVLAERAAEVLVTFDAELTRLNEKIRELEEAANPPSAPATPLLPGIVRGEVD